MKKWISFVLLLAVMLCACGNSIDVPTVTEASQVEETAETAATETTVPAETEADAKAVAASLIDHPVEELYEAIGYPKSSDYAPSCLKQDGEDGNLYYDGFIVYTIRQGENETVYYVE